MQKQETLTKNIILYKQYILTFTNPRFLIGSIDYYIFNRYRNYMKRFFKEPSFNEKINPKTGDITYSAEFMIENDSVKYYTKMRKSGHFIQLEKDKNQYFYIKSNIFNAKKSSKKVTSKKKNSTKKTTKKIIKKNHNYFMERLGLSLLIGLTEMSFLDIF